MIEVTTNEINKIKDYELKIMDYIHKLCKENGIRYSLFYGSLLGAVRHKGFIPWDDDIDIIMSKQDYLKFKRLCESSLPECFFLQDNFIEPGSNIPNVAKIRMNGTKLVELPNINKKMHHGVWVDIFIYDTFSGEEQIISAGRRKYITYKRRVDSSQLKHKNIRGKLSSLAFLLFHPFSAEFYKHKYGNFLKKISGNGSNILAPDCDINLSKCDIALFKNLIATPFENRNYYIFDEYDLILKALYGDYMRLPREEDRVANHNFVEVQL